VSLGGNLATEQRLEWIKRRLESSGRVRITAAAGELAVSEMTIRRDLMELEAMGLARRVRGGAVAVGPVRFADRHRQRAHAKAKIASKLLPLVPETGAIALDASSTLLRLAALVQGARDLTVITNGLETFQALQGKPGVHPLITGGELDPRTGSLVGPLAVSAASTFLLSHFFTSAAAVEPKAGASEAALSEAEVKHALAYLADRVVLAVDSSKLDSRSLASSLSWAEIDFMVTDLDPASPRLSGYRSITKLR
jgi:DeoR family fructose operon transcriptional repressor